MIAKDKKLEVSEDPMLMDKAKAMILEMREKSFDQACANNQVVAHEQAISVSSAPFSSASVSLSNFTASFISRRVAM